MDTNEVLRLDNQLCFAIYTSSRLMTRAYAPLLEEFDLTYPQYLAMLVLWEHEEMGVHQLGEKLYLDTGTITPLLKRLESKGLLRRKRSETDERKVFITLTDEGQKMKQAIVQVPIKLYQQSCMDIDELRSLKQQLESLIGVLLKSELNNYEPIP